MIHVGRWTVCAVFAATFLVAVESLAAGEHGPRHAVSLLPLSLAESGLAIQYENYVAPPHWSLATTLGFRSGSAGDFRSLTTSTGLGLRYWIASERPGRLVLGARPMTGPFVGARADGAWTLVTGRPDGRYVGGNRSILGVVAFGFRVPIAGRIEISPEVGAGARVDADPRRHLAPWSRFVLRGGLTVGVLL